VVVQELLDLLVRWAQVGQPERQVLAESRDSLVLLVLWDQRALVDRLAPLVPPDSRDLLEVLEPLEPQGSLVPVDRLVDRAVLEQPESRDRQEPLAQPEQLEHLDRPEAPGP